MAMNAAAQSLIGMITGANSRFVIPVYQRPYSWGEDQCLQLWDDIISIGKRPADKHFTGSVVWVQDGTMSASGVTPLLLIDGQQRITTLTLIIAALADFAHCHPDAQLHFSYEEIMGRGYLIDEYKKGDDRYKLLLSQGDKATLMSLLDNLDDPDVKIIDESSRIIENFAMFRKKIELLADPNVVWDGIQRLDVVSISLDAGRDNPQLIFESMNSTGKDLSSADLIRNFVLLGLPRDEQNKLYANHWRVIEETLGPNGYDEVFDEFVRNYLTVLYAPEQLAKRDVYPLFKRHVLENGYDKEGRMVELLRQMEAFANYYASITSGKHDNPELSMALAAISKLNVSVANPLLLSLFEDYDAGAFGMVDFIAMVHLLESYIFRRAVCDAATNSLNKFFPSIIAKLNKVQEEGGNYREAYEAYFYLEADTARRFPSDAEFMQALLTRDLYHFRRSFYMLACLENQHHTKDPMAIESGRYTIEHVMPQNALAHDEWRETLGPNCEDGFEALLNNLGNLTLTAYNSELSDGTFEDKKKRIVGGYDKEYLVISKDIRDAKVWNKTAIAARANRLAKTAMQRWPFLTINENEASGYDAKPEKTPQQRGRTVFKTIVDAGFLPAGSKLIPVSEKVDITATVTKEGTIRLSNGEIFNSPSHAAARAAALSGFVGKRNGWKSWKLADTGYLIDDIRAKYLLQSGSTIASNNKGFRSVFWTGFYEFCAEQPGFCDIFGDVLSREQNKDCWVSFGLGTSKYHLDALLYTRDSAVGVDVWFRDEEVYRALYENRDQIEALISLDSGRLVWDELDADKKTRSFAARMDVNFADDDWQTIYAWMIKQMWQLRNIMRKFGE